MIASAVCNSFKTELLGGIHDLDTDVIKIALYTYVATLNASTTAYSATNEVSGAGYTAGGATLTGPVISLSGATATVDFNDASWSAALTARGALIYNSSKSNRAISVLDFGLDKVSVTTFTITFPSAASDSAIIRIE